MPKLTSHEQTSFLETPGILMRISCVRPDGSPLVTPIWFVLHEGSICFTPRAQSEWFGCLRNDPRVALCIDEQALPYRKVIVEGTAELVHDLGEDDAWRDLYRSITFKTRSTRLALYTDYRWIKVCSKAGACPLMVNQKPVSGTSVTMHRVQNFQKPELLTS